MDNFKLLTEVFIDDLKTLCDIFEDHTLPALPEWLEDTLEELKIR